MDTYAEESLSPEDAVIKTTKIELVQISRDGWVEQAIRFLWRLIFQFPKVTLLCIVIFGIYIAGIMILLLVSLI